MRKFFATVIALQLMLLPVALAQSSGDQFRENPGAKGGGNYAKQILSLSQGIIGSSIITACPAGAKSTSLLVYMAGSLAYIASEILGGKAQNQNHKKRASDLKMIEEKMKGGSGGDVQKASLEQALKEEKETLAFINKRKMWMMAISAVYAAATGLAVMEMANPTENLIPACPETGGAAILGVSLGTAKIVAIAYSFVGAMTGEGGMISMLAPLAMMIKSVSNFVPRLYARPQARAITFGVSTALSGLIMKGLMDQAKVTKDNINKLEKVLANWKESTQTTTTLAQDTDLDKAGAGSITGASSENSALRMLAEGDVPKHCWSNSPEGMSFSEASCKNAVRLNRPQFDANLNIPTLSTAANLATDMANGFATGNIGAAEASAAQLGSMAGRIVQTKDNLQKQLNDKLIAEGKNPIDFEKEIQSQLNQQMQQLGAAGGGASLAALPTDPNAGKLVDEAKEKPTDIQTASAGATISTPPGASGVFSEGLTDDPSLAQIPVALDEKAEFDYEEKDISEKQDVSIFQQVSNRYLFSYPKIFDMRRPEDAPAN
jgi:hypothetical protein